MGVSSRSHWRVNVSPQIWHRKRLQSLRDGSVGLTWPEVLDCMARASLVPKGRLMVILVERRQRLWCGEFMMEAVVVVLTSTVSAGELGLCDPMMLGFLGKCCGPSLVKV